MIYFHFFFLFIFFFRTENEANENKVKSRGNERVTVAVVSLMRRSIHQVAATATRISPSPQTKLPPLSRVPPGGLDLNGRGQWGTTESRGGGGGDKNKNFHGRISARHFHFCSLHSTEKRLEIDSARSSRNFTKKLIFF